MGADQESGTWERKNISQMTKSSNHTFSGQFIESAQLSLSPQHRSTQGPFTKLPQRTIDGHHNIGQYYMTHTTKKRPE